MSESEKMIENIKVISGTGDGGEASRGFTPGRKIKAFLWLVASIIFVLYVAVKINAPVEMANQALWIVGLGGLFVIGGQSLVDAIAKGAAGYAVAKSDSKKE